MKAFLYSLNDEEWGKAFLLFTRGEILIDKGEPERIGLSPMLR